jgi:hypothetical protein
LYPGRHVDTATVVRAHSGMVDVGHYDLLVVLGFIAGGLVVGFGVLGKFARDIHRQNTETQRMTRAVAVLIVQETGKLRK